MDFLVWVKIGLLSKCDSDEPKHYLDNKQEASNLKEDNKFLKPSRFFK
jgi:hypothetical protein